MQKQAPNYLIYTPNHQVTWLRCSSTTYVSLSILQGRGEGIPEAEVHVAEDLPQYKLEFFIF